MSVQENLKKRSFEHGSTDTETPQKIPRLDLTTMGKSPIALLNEKIGVNNIEFVELSVNGPSHAPEFVIECGPSRDHSSEILNLLSNTNRFKGKGNSKQKAKNQAASLMLESIIDVQPNLFQPKQANRNSSLKSDDISGPLYTNFSIKKEIKFNDGLNSSFSSDKIANLLTNQSAVSVLNLIRPGLDYTIHEETTTTKNPCFLCIIDFDGNIIRGEAKSKQTAKQNAALAVLRSVYDVDFESLIEKQAGLLNESDCKNEDSIEISIGIPLSQSFADNFQFMVKDQFNEICDTISPEFSSRKVLAGIMMTRPAIDNLGGYERRMLCVTTGTKCLNGDQLCLTGEAINDCHAEILARRCFQRYLYRQMLHLLGKIPKEEFGDEWIILNKVTGKNQFELLDGVKFHLYISSAPCGDARVYILQNPDTERDNHPTRRSKGILRTKIEKGEGTVPNQSETGIQTCDGILNGERLLTMSCSDKVCLWNAIGLQGALLSHLLTRPIYISSLVLGSLYNRANLKRAVYERVANMNFSEAAMDNGYKVMSPGLYLASSQVERTPTKSPEFGINWSSGDSCVEVVLTKIGRPDKGVASRLCKKLMMERFLTVIRSLEQNPNAYSDYTYGDLKHKMVGSAIYLESKKKLAEHLKKNGFGIWVNKPFELEDFLVD